MPNQPATQGADTVLLENIQTLRTIDAAKAVLEQRLSPASDVIVDCSRIEEADIACVQLLLSARKTAERLGATLRLAGVPPVLRDLLDRCGTPDDPFWNGEAP